MYTIGFLSSLALAIHVSKDSEGAQSGSGLSKNQLQILALAQVAPV